MRLFTKNKKEKITILILLVLGIVFCSTVYAQTKEEISLENNNDYIIVYIESGDTIWSLAKEYTNNHKDIRETVHTIGIINNLESWKVYPGQSIKIPISKD